MSSRRLILDVVFLILINLTPRYATSCPFRTMDSASKFTLLSPEYLASQPPSSEITMQNLIDTSERMADEAKEIMPYSFDECTFSKGHLRQSIWSCLGERMALLGGVKC